MKDSQLFNSATWQNPWQALDDSVLPLKETDTQSVQTTGFLYMTGSLQADYFKIETDAKLIAISGNGNVSYGQGEYDLLDLSDISINDVQQIKDSAIDGVLFNPGNGARLFDAIFLKDGRQILFEGLDIIQFSDETLYLSVFPNDPDYDRQWNLHMMGVHNAWRFTQGTSTVLIGIQDTGLAYKDDEQPNHPDLRPTIAISQNVRDDFSRNSSDPSCITHISSHGTRVQSIISAASNNGEGISGINWHSHVVHADVIGNDEDDMSLSQATAYMLEIAQQRSQRLVLNLSLSNAVIDESFDTLVERNQDNALFVIASGNENKECLAYPASLGQRCRNVIAVGASWGDAESWRYGDRIGSRVRYSSKSGSNYGPGLSLTGPSNVAAVVAVKSLSGINYSYANEFKGTSAAAPNVAGVASLVWSLCPELTAEQVHYILAETACCTTPDSTYDLETGHGVVYAEAAARRAIAIKKYLSPSTTKASASIPFTQVAPCCQLAS